MFYLVHVRKGRSYNTNLVNITYYNFLFHHVGNIFDVQGGIPSKCMKYSMDIVK